jgi:hypothetical protein
VIATQEVVLSRKSFKSWFASLFGQLALLQTGQLENLLPLLPDLREIFHLLALEDVDTFLQGFCQVLII